MKHVENKKQAAVDWLVEQIWKREPLEHEQKIIEQAKEMEAEQQNQLAIDFAKWLAKEWMSIWVVDRWLWEYQVEQSPDGAGYLGYFTEEQLYWIFKKQQKEVK